MRCVHIHSLFPFYSGAQRRVCVCTASAMCVLQKTQVCIYWRALFGYERCITLYTRGRHASAITASDACTCKVIYWRRTATQLWTITTTAVSPTAGVNATCSKTAAAILSYPKWKRVVDQCSSTPTAWRFRLTIAFVKCPGDVTIRYQNVHKSFAVMSRS